MAREITLVDAGLGNLASVERALLQVGASVVVSDDPDRVATSRMVVFPGQGAFGDNTRELVDGAMGAALKMVIERGDPFLGICLGMQLLFDGSDEAGGHEGLHVLPGRCRRFPDDMQETIVLDPAERPSATPPTLEVTPSAAAGEALPVAAPHEPTNPGLGSSFGMPSSDPPSLFVHHDHHAADRTDAGASASSIVASATSASPRLLTAIPPAIPVTDAAPRTLQRRLKVPHMGWNQVEPTLEHYYFVHSYYAEVEQPEDVMWMTTYGTVRFPAAVRRANVLGCQFHPEKSQRAGLKFLRAFVLGGWT